MLTTVLRWQIHKTCEAAEVLSSRGTAIPRMDGCHFIDVIDVVSIILLPRIVFSKLCFVRFDK